MATSMEDPTEDPTEDATADPTADPADALGVRVAQVRAARGCTQLRLAELLCAASGTATVTRHEVSRWERGQRVPNAFWLRWLAVVLDVPLNEFERAAAVTRGVRAAARRRAASLASLEDAAGRTAAPSVEADDWRYWTVVSTPGAGRSYTTAELRRLDDLVGGADLSHLVNHMLRLALAAIAAARGQPGPAELGALAELAQLVGWVNGDAGNVPAARAAHRLGLRAARSAGDAALVGHLLGNAAQVATEPVRALALARAGAGELAHTGSAGGRALALQRVAYASARVGDPEGCERAIAGAERMFARRVPADEPAWLYWLTENEFEALSGRCYAVLRRPRLAVPLLSHALTGIRQPRSVALYTSWLAEAHLDSGSPERAAELASDSLVAAVRSGSVRAAARVRALHTRLAAAPQPAVELYLQAAAEGLTYLADVTGAPAAPAAGSG